MIRGESVYSDAIKAPSDHQFNLKKDTQNGTSFTYDGVKVNVKFTADGKGLNELLVNYFKNRD